MVSHIARLPKIRLPLRVPLSQLDKKVGRGQPQKCWTEHVRENPDAVGLTAS